MASSKPQTLKEIQTVRVNFLDPQEQRTTSVAQDQRFINGYFDPVYNALKKDIDFFFTKRPGLSNLTQPPAGATTGRGVYSWRGTLYSVFGTKIYGGITDLGVTLTTTTGICDFAETRPGATTQYLGVNDGTSLYLIATDNTVVVLNNVAITSSSVANPSVITTATAHGLATGNKVYIVGHTGATPSINGTVYAATVTGASTFTIPVNVTIGGTGGTLGVFPSTNTGDLLYMDGYWFTMKTTNTIWNCDVDNPLIWDPSKFITAQMYSGTGVGLARQNNYLLCYSDTAEQAFFDNANAAGSPLNNADQAVQQIGCYSNASIAHEEGTIFWVGASKTGGLCVWALKGITSEKEVSTPTINRVLMAEGTSISSCIGDTVRIGGRLFYILTLTSASRTFVYDPDIELWFEWTNTAGTGKFPIVSFTQHNNTLVAQDGTNGRLYTFSNTVYQDSGSNFPVVARTKRVDLDTIKRKFIYRLDLIGDVQSSTTNVSVQYSDDDYVTTSTARTLDMSLDRPFGYSWGNFRRRSWQTTYTGANPFRCSGIEFDFALGAY